MRQRLGDWWRWVTATRARRTALTLAVLAAMAAMAAPFATSSYKVKLHSFREVPMTAEERANSFAAWGAHTEDYTEDCNKYDLTTQVSCEEVQALKRGTFRVSYPSLWKYVALNGAVVLAVLTVTFFALTAAMAAVRKWWRWWW
jgi:hypothetical protein